jgi:hypothetical protein
LTACMYHGVAGRLAGRHSVDLAQSTSWAVEILAKRQPLDLRHTDKQISASFLTME